MTGTLRTMLRSPSAALIGILAATFLVFAPSLQFPFTNWDDDIHITENPLVVQGASWSSVPEAFAPTDRYMYHPVTILSYMADQSLSGGAAAWYHTVNVVLHLFNIIAAYVLLRRLPFSKGVVLLAVGLFAFHPLQTESVVWISARKELLYSFFVLLTAIAAERWYRHPGPASMSAAVLLFALALLSKPTAVVIPVIAGAVVLVQRRHPVRTALVLPAALLVLAAAFMVFLLNVRTESVPSSVTAYAAWDRWPLIAYTFAFYLWKFFIPAGLSACYSYPAGFTVLHAVVLLSMALLAAVLLRSVRGDRAALIAAFSAVLLLLPVSQLVPFANASLVSDRYAYLPLLPMALFVGEGLRRTLQGNGADGTAVRWFGRFAVTAALVIAALTGAERTMVWRSSISLFTDVIAKDPSIAIAYGNRGNALVREGRYREGVDDVHRLLRLHPENARAYYNLGNAYSGMEWYDSAISSYDTALKLGFRTTSLYYNHGNALYQVGRTDEAMERYRFAASMAPGDHRTWYSMGVVELESRRNPAAAASLFDTALRSSPHDAATLVRKAEALMMLDRPGAALLALTEAMRLAPGIRSESLERRIDSSLAATTARIDSLSNVIDRSPYDPALYSVRASCFLRTADTVRWRNDQMRSASLRGARR